MRIWLLRFDVNKYNSFNGYKIEEELNIRFFGSSLLSNWSAHTIEAYYKKRKIADVSDFSCGAPLFNEKAVEALMDLLNESVELLLCYFENSRYYVANVVNVIDALDKDKTQFKMFSTGEKSVECEKYVFKPEIVDGQHIFKIPLGNSIYIFVSDEFKRRVEETKLKGFIFVEVWNSEEDSTKYVLESKAEDINAESTNLKQQGETFKEKEKEVYPDISEEEAKILHAQIIVNLFDVVLQHVKEIDKDKGLIDSIGLEYFFDGQYTDIGLKINLLSCTEDDSYEEIYYQLLNKPEIKSKFNTLYSHYIKDYMVDNQTSIFFQKLQDIISCLNERMQNTKWESAADFTKNFSIEVPELYD